MSNGTILQQGKFTSAGVAKTLILRSDVDYIEVDNYTTSAAGGAGTGVEFKWQLGMADDTGFEYQKLAADDSITKVVLASGGFTRVDYSENPLSAINTTGTAISNAAIPVVAATSTAGLIDGDIVRLVNPVGAMQFGGIDFSIDTVVANTSFRLVYAPQIVAGTTVSFFKVKHQPLFYPRTRTISSITQAASAVVITTVTHGYTVGQTVKFNVGTEFGMSEINGLQGTITAVDTTTNSFTVDIDSSGFTAYAWPLTADVPFTHATVAPVGEGSSMVAAGKFEGSKVNVGLIGMTLAAGVDSPAGALNDVIYWRAYKAIDVDNE